MPKHVIQTDGTTPVANQVTYWTSSSAIGGNSGYTFDPTLTGSNDTETVLNLSKTLSAVNSDIGADFALMGNDLTVDGSASYGNDGPVYYTAQKNSITVKQDVTAGGAVGNTWYTGVHNIVSASAHNIDGTSDASYSYAGALNEIQNIGITVSAGTNDPSINVYGLYNGASAFVTNSGSGTPTINYYGSYNTATRLGGVVPNQVVGSYFGASGGTLNYGLQASGATAALQAIGHILPSTNNSYTLGNTSLRMSKVWSVDADFSGQTVLSTTGSSAGIVIGSGLAQFYEGTATSGSGDTLVNTGINFRRGNMALNAPTNTSTTANEYGLQVTKTFQPANASSGRTWGLSFNATIAGSVNMTDATSALVGVEGTVSNNSTATVTAMSAAILFNAMGANSTTSRYAGIDVYGADVSGSGGVGATATEASGALIRMGRSSGNTSVGNITDLWGVQLRASTWSGTGHMTNQKGFAYFTGQTMNAITANSQKRIMFEVPDMPSPGAFTSTEIIGLKFNNGTRAIRNGMAWGTSAYLWESAASVLTLAGDSAGTATASLTLAGSGALTAPGYVLTPLITSVAGVGTTITIRGQDIAALVGSERDIVIRGGNATSKTGDGGILILQGGTKGSASGNVGYIQGQKTDGSTKTWKADDNTFSILNLGLKLNRTAVADANYTVLLTDQIVSYTSLTAGRTVTALSAATAGAGYILIVKDEAGGAATNNITITPTSGNIDGAASKVINTNYGTVTIYSNGTNWFTI